MERSELLGLNGKIFAQQGKVLAEVASRTAKVLVVGNPCNTNAWIAMQSGQSLPADRWFAMTRLDENRAKARLPRGRELVFIRWIVWRCGEIIRPRCIRISRMRGLEENLPSM
jgi:hypothetical protein